MPWFLAVGACLLLGMSASAAAPAVVITNLPAYGTFSDLGGVVLDANPAACRVATFIFVPGYGWVSKPTCAQPLTTIQPNGSWSAGITTGGSDRLATRVAALLVSTNYNQPCVQGLANLPTNVYAQAIASAVVTRQYPGPRWLSFSGYEWWVKSSTGPVGPGPNTFSDSTNNVWLDAQGRLHLRITNRSNQWQCAEIVSARTFGYGSYRFELASRVDNLDMNAVLGLFTWSDDPAYTYREIDVECARWGNAADTNNAQFVVQPFGTPGHLLRYQVPANQTNSTHVFTWETNRVSFQSQRGSYSPAPVSLNVIKLWSYSLAVPKTGDENVRLNLWLFNGAAPTGNQEVEVVIRSFEFVPLDTPQPAKFKSATRQAGATTRLVVEGQPDFRHEFQAASGLSSSWQPLGTVLATSPAFEFVDTNAGAAPMRFYRALTLP